MGVLNLKLNGDRSAMSFVMRGRAKIALKMRVEYLGGIKLT